MKYTIKIKKISVLSLIFILLIALIGIIDFNREIPTLHASNISSTFTDSTQVVQNVNLLNISRDSLSQKVYQNDNSTNSVTQDVYNADLTVADNVYGNNTNSVLVGLKKNVDSTVFLSKKLNNKKSKKMINTHILAVDLNATEIKNMQRDEDVAFVESNSPVNALSQGKIIPLDSKSNTSNANTQIVPWGISSIGADIAMNEKKEGELIKIAVLDTGVSNEQDLNVQDGVSFVDGITDYSDDNGHGSHVAGTIAALNNTTGVVGAASKTKIYPVKVLDKNGSGSYSQVIQGIDWAVENNMDIVSISFGGTKYSQALHDAIIKANNKGILIVSAAGNRGVGDETVIYPALFPEVASVGAVDSKFNRSWFSSTGSRIDLVAPGSLILSTLNNGSYGYLSGTSMAVPHVVGAAAVLWSENKTWTSKQIKQKLYDTATSLGDVHDYGHGLVNVAKALGLINTTIAPPVNPLVPADSKDNVNLPDSIGEVNITSENQTGNNQTIYTGGSATVSVFITSNQFNPPIDITVTNSSGTTVAGTTIAQPANTTVSYTWNTTINTPPGQYTIQYHYPMYPMYDDYFAINVVKRPDDATIISDTIPTTMEAGTIYPVSVTVFNNGTNTWSETNWYRLGAMNDNDPLSPGRIYILNGQSVAPGQQYTFNFNMVAPSNFASLGNKITDWQMVRDAVAWFGGTIAKTVNVVDTTPPSIPNNLLPSLKTSTSFKLTWNASTDNVGVSSYDIYNGLTKINADKIIGTSYTVSGLTPNTLYGFTVKANDLTGNVSSASSIFNVTTNISAVLQNDIIPKMTSDTSPSGVATASSILSSEGGEVWRAFDDQDALYAWHTNAQQTGWLAYQFPTSKIIQQYTILPQNCGCGPSRAPKSWTFDGWNGYTWVQLDTQTNVGGWQVGGKKYFSFSNNSAFTKYRINITANNGDGYLVIGEMEMMEGDFSPPTSPTNLLVTSKTDNAVGLSWGSSTDNIGVTGYEVYRGSTLVGSTNSATTTTFTATGLSSSTTYNFFVKAKDSSGNMSNSSNVLFVTTNVDSPEVDDINSGAIPISYNLTYSAYINTATDVDFYKYTSSTNGIEQITLSVPSNKNYDVYVYDSNMNLIAAGIRGSGLTEEVIYKVTLGTTYYIKIVTINGDIGTTPYALSLSKSVVKYQTDYQYDTNGNMLRKTMTIVQ